MSLNRTLYLSFLCLTFLSACQQDPKPPEIEPPVLPEVTLGDTTVGVAYTRALTATGGVPPLSYTAEQLPPGLSLSTDAGQLSGTATADGDFSVSVKVTDARGKSVTKAYAMRVYATPTVTSDAMLSDGYEEESLSVSLVAGGGKAPLTWSVMSGELPSGLSLGAEGTLSGIPTATGAEQTFSFTVRVVDAHGAKGTRTFSLSTYPRPRVATASLTPATEGVTYRKAPGTPELLRAEGGKPPRTLSVTGLPPGLTFEETTGTLSGLVPPGGAGSYDVEVRVTDANGRESRRTLTLPVGAPRPLPADGTQGVEPSGSPLTEVLTVFVIGEDGQPRRDVGVRVRKNGVEYAPAKQALTDARGKVYFTGLGLNGHSDTVDITANGAGLWNATLAQVNASLVTLMLPSYSLPLPRVGASATFDAKQGRLLVTSGQLHGSASAVMTGAHAFACTNDLLSLRDVGTASWDERFPPAMASAPSARRNAAFQYGGVGLSILFGGRTCADELLGDTWQYDSTANTWTRMAPTASPSPRSNAALVSAPIATGDAEVILFGGLLAPVGRGGSLPTNEVWTYNSGLQTWSNWTLSSSGTAPPSRSSAGAALEPETGRAWFCGGEGYEGSFVERQDCVSWSTSSHAWQTQPSLPAPRKSLTMDWWPGVGLYVFGGVSGNTPRNDLLLYRPGTGWSTVTAHGAAGSPPASAEARLVYDSQSQGLLLFIGERAELWSFNGTTWTKHASPQAPTTYTVSGTLSGALPNGTSLATLWASSPSGFSAQLMVYPVNGTATYSIPGVPAGSPLVINVLNQLNGVWSYLDTGEVGPITANTTLNLTLPPGPLSLREWSGTIVPPSDWPTWFEFTTSAHPRVLRPGYPPHTNGNSVGYANSIPKFGASAMPVSPPLVQRLEIETTARVPGVCQVRVTNLDDRAPGVLGPVVLPGTDSLFPGIDICGPQGTGLIEPTYTGQTPGYNSVGSDARRLAVGDIDRSGVEDVVVANQGSKSLSLLFGAGNIYFTPQTVYTGSWAPTDVALADLNGDASLDLVVVSQQNHSVSVYPGTGGRTLGTATHHTLPATPTGVATGPARVAVGDVTGDGKPDLVLATESSQELVTLRNNGAFGFTLLTRSPHSGLGIRQLLLEDLTGDGRLDALVTQSGSGELALYPGNGAGGFEAATLRLTAAPSSSPPVAAGTSDLDGDGQRDIVALFDDAVRAWRLTPGTTPGTTAYGAQVEVPQGAASDLALADFSGDGVKDVVVTLRPSTSGGDNVRLLQDTGSGFVPWLSYKTGAVSPEAVSVGDFNGDQQADLAMLQTSSSVSSLAARLMRKPLPRLSEGTYRFTAREGVRLFTATRGANGMTRDWKYVGPARPGTNTFDFPLPSTLAPSRPTPGGQQAAWELSVYTFPASSGFRYENLRWQGLGESGKVMHFQHGFHRE